MLFEFSPLCGGVPVYQISDKEHLVLCADKYGSKMDYWEANEHCLSGQAGGFCDWIIPSISQLSILHKMRDYCHLSIGDGWYWSSDVFTENSQWICDIKNGTVSTSYHDKKLLLIKARIHINEPLAPY
ncbi:MAG: hypothetical protein ACR2HF_04725 [Methylococcaceae bacterium]